MIQTGIVKTLESVCPCFLLLLWAAACFSVTVDKNSSGNMPKLWNVSENEKIMRSRRRRRRPVAVNSHLISSLSSVKSEDASSCSSNSLRLKRRKNTEVSHDTQLWCHQGGIYGNSSIHPSVMWCGTSLQKDIEAMSVAGWRQKNLWLSLVLWFVQQNQAF